MSSNLSIHQEYQFNANDYKLMRFNPMGTDKTKTMLDNFPSLARFLSFGKLNGTYGKDADKVVKYILLCYDPNSPAVTQIPDIFRRKSWCGYAAGFDTDKETTVFTERYYKAINCEIQEVNLAILDFCSLFGSLTYTSLVAGSEAIFRKQRTMSEIVDDDKKTVLDLEKTRGELWKQIQAMQKDLQALELQYLTERNTYLVADLYRLVNEEVYKRLSLTPERRAMEKGTLHGA
jgi:hypothetical protein